ncbi:MAG: kynureninase [Chloroflexota bacterium]
MSNLEDTTRAYAAAMDDADPLAGFRSRFVMLDPDLIYLDGNSLGRPPRGVATRMQQAVETDWGADLIRGWNKGWWEAPRRIGELIAPLLGAGTGQVIVSDQTSVNLFKLAAAALALRPGRSRIITDSLNFPSDLYILQGLVRMLGGQHEIVRIGSRDNGITPDLEALASAIDERTALVTLSHVTYKSGYLYDMRAVSDLAQRAGALMLWDLSHSAGVVPIALDDCGVDLAIGCTYKYLNGGPGAPAFLYVRTALQPEAQSPIWGWWGEAQPFTFGLDYQPAPGVQRFLTGTAPILSVIALEEGLAPLLEAGIERIRQKSVALSQYAIGLSERRLASLGFSLGSPGDPGKRGSHISLRHHDGYRINRALIEEMNVIPDFREPDNLRLGLSPLYVSFQDVWEAMERLGRVVAERRFEKHPLQRLPVT